MSEVDIKDALQRALVHLNNLSDRTHYFDLYDDNSLVMHGLPPNLPTNKDGLKTFYMGLFQAFPDLNVKFEDVLVEGNKAAARFTMTGTQKGKFMGIPPNNKPIKVQGMSLFAFSGSK
jgi:predicted ester cyclase